MKKLFAICFSLTGLCLLACGQKNVNTKLPETWNKDFTIRVTISGNMNGSHPQTIFTYDSCVHVSRDSNGNRKREAIALTQKDRNEILQFLKRNNVEKFTSKYKRGRILDGSSRSICFFGSDVPCMEVGTSYRVGEENAEIFRTVYDYLDGFPTK